ncbi:MAG: cation diffusion facilitator family transporter [Chloroflexota bacterium]
MFSSRIGAARLLIGVVVSLMVVKALVARLTGSISVLAQASDSLLDIFAGMITLLAVRAAAKPADEEHPYGHGKVEDIAGAAQALLLFAAGGLIIRSSVQRIISGTTIELTEAGIAVMLVSIVVSVFLSRHLLKVARATDSVALEANSRNIAADVYSASAVLAGLLAVRFTGMSVIDPALAIGVAVYILWMAIAAIRRPLSGLVDSRLSSEEEAVMRGSLTKHSHEVVGFHDLRTRRAGSQRYMELHLVMYKRVTLEQAHSVCDQIEADVKDGLREVKITIHAEPCNDACERCAAICSSRPSGR